jgi:hypothetical protein
VGLIKVLQKRDATIASLSEELSKYRKSTPGGDKGNVLAPTELKEGEPDIDAMAAKFDAMK